MCHSPHRIPDPIASRRCWMKRWRSALSLLVLPALAHAQGDGAAVTGAVRDASGAVLADGSSMYVPEGADPREGDGYRHTPRRRRVGGSGGSRSAASRKVAPGRERGRGPARERLGLSGTGSIFTRAPVAVYSRSMRWRRMARSLSSSSSDAGGAGVCSGCANPAIAGSGTARVPVAERVGAGALARAIADISAARRGGPATGSDRRSSGGGGRPA